MTDRKGDIWPCDQKGYETKGENGVAEAGSEVLPQRSAGTGVVGREEERQHKDESAGTGGSDQEAEGQSEADSEFAVSREEGDGGGVRQDEAFKGRDHEWIGAAVLEPLVDPELKAAVKSELSTEDLIFAEDEEEDADGDAKESESAGVGVRRVRSFG